MGAESGFIYDCSAEKLIGESNKVPSIIKYPKFLLIFLTYLAAYALFTGRSYPGLGSSITGMGYIGCFTAGLLYAYAFTAAPATVMLLMLGRGLSPLPASIVAGVGALVSDLLIFHFVRHGFGDEVSLLSGESVVRRVKDAIPEPIRGTLYLAVASVLIASPLPTELGVTLMASTTNISAGRFAVVAYLLHTCGVLIILLMGSLV